MKVHSITTEQILSLKDKWVEQKVRVLTGKYKGRKATVWRLMFRLTDEELTAIAFIHIRSKKDPADYVRAHTDTRRSYNIEKELKLIKDWN